MTPDLKLPACEKCRKSKVRCDSAAPKCSTCSKARAACIILDVSTGQRYSRESLEQMRQKLERLEAEYRRQSNASPTESNHLRPLAQAQAQTHYVGNGSGLNIFHRVSSSIHTAGAQTELIEQLNLRSPRHELTIPEQELPPYDLARTLVDRYYSHSHLHHPFLTRASVSEIFDRLYNEIPSSEPVPQDLYRFFMISAISGVTMYRKGYMKQHPYGYFRSAQRLISQVKLIGSLDAIRNLLLVARFAMYYHIESSIWDISRLCMRQCIELNLHKNPSQPMSPMDEQARRNTFWDCYVHDRYSSGILGRPYAITEADIEVKLPVMMSEEDILHSNGRSLDDLAELGSIAPPNESSVSVFVIQLRRLTTNIHNHFFSSSGNHSANPKPLSSAGRIQVDLSNFSSKLDECLKSAPTFENPKSLYERGEWHDFLVEKDRLSLLRGAIANIPIGNLPPSRKLLHMCMACATRVIVLYANLFTNGYITWTRSYFQILFTSGLSIMYSLSVLKVGSGSAIDTSVSDSACHALAKCTSLLFRFVVEMPDAKRFAAVFEALSRQYTNLIKSSDLDPVEQQEIARPVLLDQALTIGVTEPSQGLTYEQPSNVENAIQSESHPSFDFPMLDMDIGDLQYWSSYPTNAENVLGQMEVGLGEYAWGGATDSNVWEQYFSSR